MTRINTHQTDSTIPTNNASNTSNARQTGHDPATYTVHQAKIALALLLTVYILSVLCLQAFGFIFTTIGTDLHTPAQAQLIASIPALVLGIVCFIYGSLGDYVSLKKMTMIGLALLIAGSVLGLALHFNVWLVIIARVLQTCGGQVAGSVYLVIAARYLPDKIKSSSSAFLPLATSSQPLSAFSVLAFCRKLIGHSCLPSR